MWKFLGKTIILSTALIAVPCVLMRKMTETAADLKKKYGDWDEDEDSKIKISLFCD